MKKSIKKGYPLLILVFAITILSAALEGVLTIYMMKIIDSTLDGNREVFLDQAKLLIGVAISLLPINILRIYVKGLYKRKALIYLKGDYLKSIFNKNISEFQEENNAKYLSAITNDMNTIEMNYINSILEAGFNIINFLVAIIVIASVSPWALGIGIVISGISTVLAIFLGKPLQKHQNHRSQLFEGYTSYIKEVLGAFHIIKSNNLNEKIHKDYYDRSKDIQEKRYIIDKIETYFLSTQHFIMSSSFFGIAAIVVYMAIMGEITFGGVVLIVNNMEKVIYPVMQFAEWLPKIFSTKSIFIKLDKTLENKNEYIERLTLSKFENSIDIRGVSFGYTDKPILDDISLSFKKGEKYLIVGPSGGGKSTLLKLLRKYFNPQKGEIFIDGQNLMDITKESYFQSIANIEQQVFLFEDSLKNNITLYKEYTEEEIQDAIKKSGLEDFVRGLPLGLDTIIYDNGKNISGGEKSRIAIARGLISKANIIFLDEAFSSLDAKIAREIEQTLLNLEDVTVINISHIIFEDTQYEYNSIYKVGNGSVIII